MTSGLETVSEDITIGASALYRIGGRTIRVRLYRSGEVDGRAVAEVQEPDGAWRVTFTDPWEWLDHVDSVKTARGFCEDLARMGHIKALGAEDSEERRAAVNGYVEHILREIRQDILNGQVPTDARTMGDLDDHVDSNEYLINAEVPFVGDDMEVTNFNADVINEVNRRLGELKLLSADEVEAIGLDAAGRDGDGRFPHTEAKLTADERVRLAAFREQEAAMAMTREIKAAVLAGTVYRCKHCRSINWSDTARGPQDRMCGPSYCHHAL